MWSEDENDPEEVDQFISLSEVQHFSFPLLLIQGGRGEEKADEGRLGDYKESVQAKTKHHEVSAINVLVVTSRDLALTKYYLGRDSFGSFCQLH